MKRAFDILLSLALLCLFLPLLVLLFVLVFFKIGRPVLFTQIRPGKGGKPFKIIKFRTMTSQTDANGELLPDAERLVSFGRFLRSTSLDELPELLNVLKGEMSFVGPRPLLMQYLDRYSPEQARRMELKPGITGWAQVNGRNAIGWKQKFELDVWYVDHQSFWLDLKILWMTAWKTAKRSDISQEGEATMEEFMGDKEK